MVKWSGGTRRMTAHMGDLTLEARNRDHDAEWCIFVPGMYSTLWLKSGSEATLAEAMQAAEDAKEFAKSILDAFSD